jgi:hypothetical protein
MIDTSPARLRELADDYLRYEENALGFCEVLHAVADEKEAAERQGPTTYYGYPEPLTNFAEGQWWVKELDRLADDTSATAEQKRAIAVVHHLLKAVRAEAAEKQEPVAWVRKHPDGTLTEEFLPTQQIEPVRRAFGAWAPLYLGPQPSEPAPVEVPLPDTPWLLYMPDRPYESELKSHECGYEVSHLIQYAEARAKAAIDAQQAELSRALQSEKEGWRYSKELEEARKQLEAEMQAEIDRLTKQAAAYQRLVKSLEDQRGYLRSGADRAREAVATLASEREANAILTEEIDRLKSILGDTPKEKVLTHIQQFLPPLPDGTGDYFLDGDRWVRCKDPGPQARGDKT